MNKYEIHRRRKLKKFLNQKSLPINFKLNEEFFTLYLSTGNPFLEFLKKGMEE